MVAQQVLTLKEEVENATLAVQDTDAQLVWLMNEVASQFNEEWQEVIGMALTQIQENMQFMHDLVRALEVAKDETAGQRDTAMFDAEYYRNNAMHVVAGAIANKLDLGHADTVRALESLAGISAYYASGYAVQAARSSLQQLGNELFEEAVFAASESTYEDSEDYE